METSLFLRITGNPGNVFVSFLYLSRHGFMLTTLLCLVPFSTEGSSRPAVSLTSPVTPLPT